MIQVLVRLKPTPGGWMVEIYSNTEGLSESLVLPLNDKDLESISGLPPADRTWAGVLRALSPNGNFLLPLPLQKQIGSIIFQRLLGDARLRQHLERVENRSLQERRTTQYLLLIEESDPVLTTLPIELAHDSENGLFFFKRPDRPVFRCAQSADAQDLVMDTGTRVLVVTANGGAGAPSTEELRNHAEVLRQSLARAGFIAEWLEEPTPDAFERRLREGTPIDVLYFATHGVADADHCGSLRLQGGYLTGDRLGTLLTEARTRERPVSLVLLCACSSAVPESEAGTSGMAQFLSGRPRARAALGFRGPVKVDWALRFCERLFDGIGAKLSLEDAFAKARLDADERDPQWALPLLFSRPVDLWKAARGEQERFGHQPLAAEAIRQVMEERDAELRSASALMTAQKYDDARIVYEKAINRLEALAVSTPAGQNSTELLARARLGLALALLLLQEDGARIHEILTSIHPNQLSPRGKALLSQAWTAVGAVEQAELVLTEVGASDEADRQVAVARQLIALRRGIVPEPVLLEPTVLLAAAYCHAAQGQLRAAARCATLVLENAPDDGLFCFAATDLVTRILRSSVYEMPRGDDYLPRDEWPKLLRRILDADQRLTTLPLPSKMLDGREATKALLADLLRDADANVSVRVRKERLAYSLARQGKLAEALATLPESNHPWLPSLERSSLYLIGGQLQQARDEALAIENTHPGKLPIEHLLASILMAQAQPEEALPYARRVFESLPAGGHRQLLAECLLACNRHDAAMQAWQLLSEAEEGRTNENPRELRAHASATEHVDLAAAARLWDKYLSLRPQDSVCWLHAAGMHYILGKHNNAADYAWRAFESAAERALSPKQLGTIADFVQGGSERSTSERHQQIQQIVERLHRDFPEDPQGQQEALQLALVLRDPRGFRKIRFDLLERHGLIRSGNSVEELKQVLEQQREYQEAMGWLYRAGLWPDEALSISAVQLVQRAFAMKAAKEPLLSTPVHSLLTEVPALSKVHLLTGPLELFLLERLNLLFPLKKALQAGGRLLLFSKTTEDIAATLLNLTAQIQQAEVQASEDKPEVAAQVIGLRELARRAQEVQRFVAEGLREKWLESGLEWPKVELALAGDCGSIFQSTWEHALGYRTALVDHPARYLLSADFLTCTLFGGGDFLRLWLQFLRPNPDQFVRLVEQLSPTAERVITLPQLIRQLVEEGPELHRQVRLLAEIGFADALRAQDLLQVFREPALLARFERIAWLPHDPPTGPTVEAQPEQETVHPGRHMAMVHVAYEYAAAITQAFCPSEQESVSLDDQSAILNTLLNRIEAMPGAALEVACLALARLLAPKFRNAIVHDSPERSRISMNSPVGQLWTAVWHWAGADDRRRAAIGRAVTAQLCGIDERTSPSSPNWLHLATSLLGSAADENKTALAILSANWDVKPLVHEQLPMLPGTEQQNWEEIFQQAALALDRGEKIHARERGDTWGVDIPQQEKKHRYHLPAEGVLLRTKSETIVRLAPQLALHQSDLDGRAFPLLRDLANHPDDQQRRRALARLAVEAPWRLMRESPSWLLRWAALAQMPTIPLPADIAELRAMLCEPGALPRDVDLALLRERVDGGPPWSEWPGLIEQASLIPGPLSVFGVGDLFRSSLHVQRVWLSLERLANPEEYPAAQIGQDLIYLSFTAVQNPVTRLPTSEEIDVRQRLPTLMENCLRDAILREGKDAKEVDSVLADHEPGLLRLCARIVSALAWPEPILHRDGLWLSYRLYQWYMAQLMTLDSKVRTAALRHLAPSYSSPIPAVEVPLDLLHPSRLGPDGTSYRLLTLLYALALGPMLGLRFRQSTDSAPTTTDPQILGVTSSSLETLLLELVIRPLTPAEQQIKRQSLMQAPSCLGWFQGDAATIPELALLALLRRRQQAFAEMPLSARLQWISRLPRTADDADAIPRNLTDLLLQAASLGALTLHTDERKLLKERTDLLLVNVRTWFSSDMQRPVLSATWLCRIRLYEAGELALRNELQTLFRDEPDFELLLTLFPHYLVAIAEVALETMESGFREVIDRVMARGDSTTPWVSALEQVIQSSGAAAKECARKLFAELTASQPTDG